MINWVALQNAPLTPDFKEPDYNREFAEAFSQLPLPVTELVPLEQSYNWVAERYKALTVELETMTPSQWAEARRYLPPSVSAQPGPFRFDATPFAKEIIDCFDIESPIREVAWMKGAQVSATTNLENIIGYCIDHVKTAPMLLITADSELANLRLTSYILPMINESGLSHLVQSADVNNPRKTGKTDKKLEFVGGGFLVPTGAQNANKSRSLSAQVLFCDEMDGWPVLGKQGDPVKLARERTASFESSRKIFYTSTPLLEATSYIKTQFARGDQRYYHVKCLKCRQPQILRWTRTNSETAEVTGILWDEDEQGNLVPGTARYRCQFCSHDHYNDDKTKLLSEDNAEWVPTAKPVMPSVRSYHLSALYSPVGMRSWDECVLAWLEAWDVAANRPKDLMKLQVFYNNILGEPFRVTGDKIKFETVSSHRRDYLLGQVPNTFSTEFCMSKILLLTMAVDVQQDFLSVAVWGWASQRSVFLIDYLRLDGDTSEITGAVWEQLREIIYDKEYSSDDGTVYRVDVTLVDSGFRTELVYQFCSEFESSVYPCRGVDAPMRGAKIREFALSKTQLHGQTYAITADLYKERWHNALKRSWDGQSVQPTGHFNVASNTTDKQLRELIAETRVAKVEASTGRRIGWMWARSGGVRNELWDLLVYGSAALDILAWGWHERTNDAAGDQSLVWDEYFKALAKQRGF